MNEHINISTSPGAASLSSDVSLSLTPDDHATLSHLLRRSIGEDLLRAIRSDLGYLKAWSLACDGEQVPCPPTKELALRFTFGIQMRRQSI
jgi:hypothetical protein